MKITNRTEGDQVFTVAVVSPELVTVEVVEVEQMTVKPHEHASVAINVLFPTGLITGKGILPAVLRITDQNGLSRDVELTLMGPKG